jgi:alpha-tubulin suppressor-like RCC1 family protein
MNVTIASNSCVASGPGYRGTNGLAAGLQIANNNGALHLHNSIVAYSGTNSNAYGSISDDGYNISSDGSANFTDGSSRNFTDPQLAALGNYGGPTPCIALLPVSPAIDSGDSADFPTTDQRGYFRPVGTAPDMGAYEYGSYQLLVITQPPTNQVLAVGGTLTLNVTASGTAPLAYQWFKDSRWLLGATNSTLTVPNVGVTNSGTYYVVVTNSTGMVISEPVLVAVGRPYLLAWGDDFWGQLGNGADGTATNIPITVAANVVAGAAGAGHSLFVDADGTLWAMGWNSHGQLGNGTTTNANLPVSVASNVVAVAAGGAHSLFVKNDGTLWAMGWNGNGELGNGTTTSTNLPVSVASNVVAVAAGVEHSLFVKTDGTLWAMGWNFYGQLGNGTYASSDLPVIMASNVVAAAGGDANSLFVKTDGTLWWAGGNNSYPSFGTYASTNLPVIVVSNVVAVAVGVNHSLFVDTNGTLWAMGWNGDGQLGNGTTTNIDLPVNVASNVVAVAAGADHSLFTKTDATLWGMGLNSYGQLGNGTTTNTTLPINVPHLFVANVFPADQANFSLALGIDYHATITMSNLSQVYTGGAIQATATSVPPNLTVLLTYNGSLNAPTNVGSYTVIGTISDPIYFGSATNTLVITPPPPPTIIAGPTNEVVAIGGTLTLNVSAGGVFQAYQWFKDSRLLLGATNNMLTVANAGVTNSGTYYVVVTNYGGMIISLPVLVAVGHPFLLAWGDDDWGQLGNGTDNSSTNLPISVAADVVAGAAGANHSLFVDAKGTLWAMGYNGYGQLGTGITNNANVPVSVASNVVVVAAGEDHSLFVKNDGTLWAMGWNGYGQLGNGTTTNTNLPVSVASNVVAVAAGAYHSLFIKHDGTLWAMGQNNAGQLGIGTWSYSQTTPISVASNAVSVAAGQVHSLFVTGGGSLWAMGYNGYGQLGNGTTISTNLPVSVASNVVAVAAGEDHSLFVTADEILWVMGENNNAQLGNGTTSNTSLPISVASNVVAVAAGAYHSLLVKNNRTLFAMGLNNNGQLGDGTTIQANLPLIVYFNRSVANVFAADQADHTLALGIPLNPVPATVTLGNLAQLYTGSAVNITASTVPPGLTVILTYNGSPSAPTNSGSYTVIGIISDPGYYGGATNILVVVQPPQHFTARKTGANGQQLTLQLSGTPNYPYLLQSATNLTPPINWQPIITNTTDTNGNWSFVVTNLMTVPTRFYRAVGQ